MPDQPFDPLGRQVNVTGRAMRGLLDAVLADAGTTFSSWLVLMSLDARGPVIQKELARDLEVIGASIAERIDQLVAAGHVARSPVPEDRRASLVSLTPAGQAVFDALLATVRATDAALTEGLSDEDVATARRVLVQLAERARTLRAARP